MADEREALRERIAEAIWRSDLDYTPEQDAWVMRSEAERSDYLNNAGAVLAVLPSRETDSRWEDMDHPHCVRCGARIWAGQIKRDLPSGLREHANCDDPYHNAPRETVALTEEQITQALMGQTIDGNPLTGTGAQKLARAVLALFPGDSREAVEAKALRDAAGAMPDTLKSTLWLRDRADRIETHHD